jgi:hypothetical protein
MAGGSADLKAFLAARDFLLKHREDYDAAYRGFEWPQLTTFNWAFDYFDELGREDSGKIALWIVEDDGSDRRYCFAEMSRRSNQVGNFLRRLGVMRGSRIVVMLPNNVAIWEITLAALKIGAVLIPAATLLTTEDLRDRVQRADARHVIATSAVVEKFQDLRSEFTGISVGETVAGWKNYDDAYNDLRSLQRIRTRGWMILSFFTSLRARRRDRSSCCTRIKATRSVTWRRCTGSACGLRTYIAISVRRDGRSMRGAASLRRGMRARPSLFTTTRDSARGTRSLRLNDAR